MAIKLLVHETSLASHVLSLGFLPRIRFGFGGFRFLGSFGLRLLSGLSSCFGFLLGILCFLLLALLCSQQLLRMCMRCFGTMSQASRRDLHGDGVIHDVLIRLIYGSYEGI